MKQLRMGVLGLVITATMVVGAFASPSASASDGIRISQTIDYPMESVVLDDQGSLEPEFVSNVESMSDGASVEDELNYSASLILSESDSLASSPYVYEYELGDEPEEVISMEEFLLTNCTEPSEVWTNERYAIDLLESEEARAASVTQRDLQLLESELPIEPRYVQSTHRSIAFEILATPSANEFVDSRWYSALINHCDDPDDWVGFKEEHYLINLVSNGADDKVGDYARGALAKLRNGEIESGYEDLAFASHFMMDLGNPWHREWTLNPLTLALHAEFEDWVTDNWYPENLWQSCQYQVPSNYMAALQDATIEEMARHLNDIVYSQYSIQRHWLIYHHNHDKANFIASVKYCLAYTAMYTSGLYAYVAPHAMRLDEVVDPYPYAEVHGVGDYELVATFVANKIHIHLELFNTAIGGDYTTDYLYVHRYYYTMRSTTTFTDLPTANGGILEYDCVVSFYQYKKLQSIEIVWHQWTTGHWFLHDAEGETTATVVSDGFGVTQTSSTYAEAIGKTFGYDSDSQHSLEVLPVTRVNVHLEVSIPETYGDIWTDWLHIDAYYTDATYSRWTFTSLPGADGGTVIFDCDIVLDAHAHAIDYFRIEWHQWTYGQSPGNSWIMEGKTTIYWDTEPPSTYPI